MSLYFCGTLIVSRSSRLRMACAAHGGGRGAWARARGAWRAPQPGTAAACLQGRACVWPAVRRAAPPGRARGTWKSPQQMRRSTVRPSRACSARIAS